MPDNHYVNPRLAEIYDAGNGWSADRDFYLSLAGKSPIRVLDLGCGTGLLCDAYAALGHLVTGVDPAMSMLEIGRKKLNGPSVRWVQSSAQDFTSNESFDLVIMTGHAFQVLLEETDVRCAFSNVRKHLAPNGRFVFESRNPAIDWASRWNRTTNLNLSSAEIRIERIVRRMDGPRILFETFYHFPDETLISKSELRFWSAREIESMLTECGLSISHSYGDWDQGSFNPDSSEEMIFVVQARV